VESTEGRGGLSSGVTNAEGKEKNKTLKQTKGTIFAKVGTGKKPRRRRTKIKVDSKQSQANFFSENSRVKGAEESRFAELQSDNFIISAP